MNNEILTDDKAFELDALVVLRLRNEVGVYHQFELSLDDIYIFMADVLAPVLGEPNEFLFGGIALENGAAMDVTREGNEIVFSRQTKSKAASKTTAPARLSLAQAQALLNKLESAVGCIDLVHDLNDEEDDVDFIEDGSTPTPDPEFISEEEDENPSGVIPLTNHQQLSETIAATDKSFRIS